MTSATRYVFDNVEITEGDRRLLVDGRPVSVGSRALTVLLTLLAHRDRVVSKEELINAAWPQLVVEQNNLVVQIGTLRQLLGRHAITTIPGRGYKFSAGEANLPQASPAADTVVEAPRNPRIGALLGRTEDLRTIAALMTRHRIVTLVGTTGIGKTCMAQRLLADATHRFAHGGAWVELATATDERLVVDAIARALRLDLRASEPLEALSRAVRPLNMLVVIDNADEAGHEVARVVQKLAEQAPGMSFLLTGQRPLHLRDDKVVPLSPLAVPAPDATLDDALRCGAVALFVERASAADSRFALTRDNVVDVIEVCRRLDGIPLAIDMAASCVSLLGVAELKSMLGQMSTTGCDAPLCHQTLRRAIEWSHGLLEECERVVLRRLSVFARGFSLQTALAVVAPKDEAADGIDEWVALDALTELINRSLVIVDSNEPPRYRLQESTQIFAREQLHLSGEAPRLQRRHALAMRDVLVAVFETRFHDWDDAHARLAAELDNAREAMAWSLEHDPLTAVLLAPPVGWALVISSVASLDVWRATEKLLSDGMPVRARAQWAACAGLFRHPEWAARRVEWARKAVTLWRETGEREGLQMALMSMAHLVAADPAEHLRLLEESHTLDTPDMAPGIRTLQAEGAARAALWANAPERAIPAFEYALRSAITSRNSDAQDTLQLRIAHAEHVANMPADAVRHGRELVERFRGTRKTLLLSIALSQLAGACLTLHDHAGARQTLAEAWPLARAHGQADDCCDSLALICALEGRFEAAARLMGLADTLRSHGAFNRNPAMRRLAQRAERLLLEAIGPMPLRQLMQQGGCMSLDEVPALAWGTAPEARRAMACV